MQKIKILDELSHEIYGRDAFRLLPVDKQIVIVKMQKNNIAIARLELKVNKNK